MNDFVGNTKCMICGQIALILINKRLRPIPEEVQGCVHPDHPFCNECMETMKTGTFLISVSDGEKKICVVKAEAAERMFGKPRPPLVYIEDTMWKNIGLPSGDEDHTNPASALPDWIAAQCQKCGTIRGVRPDWRSKEQHSTIQARCLTCQPVNPDKDYELFPHTLEKYLDFEHYAPYTPKEKIAEAEAQAAGEKPTSPEPQDGDRGTEVSAGS